MTIPLYVGDQQTCPICIGTMENDATIVVWLKPCYHKFHCLSIMRVRLHGSPDAFKCPTCRQQVRAIKTSRP